LITCVTDDLPLQTVDDLLCFPPTRPFSKLPVAHALLVVEDVVSALLTERAPPPLSAVGESAICALFEVGAQMDNGHCGLGAASSSIGQDCAFETEHDALWIALAREFGSELRSAFRVGPLTRSEEAMGCVRFLTVKQARAFVGVEMPARILWPDHEWRHVPLLASLLASTEAEAETARAGTRTRARTDARTEARTDARTDAIAAERAACKARALQYWGGGYLDALLARERARCAPAQCILLDATSATDTNAKGETWMKAVACLTERISALLQTPCACTSCEL
jgi:hypothetical protein